MNNKLLVPGAIVVAALLVAGAIFMSNKNTSPEEIVDTDNDTETSVTINPITSDDHILGNPDAPIKIVEYSDIDCPFCAQFHSTMKQVIDEYGDSGQVAWIYRHFPIPQLHPDAPIKALASECIAKLGGNTAFWSYLDILFEREDEGKDDLSGIAKEVGVASRDFSTCLNSGELQGEVDKDSADARRSGGQGTPHSIIVVEETGENITLPGAQSFDAIQQIIETLLPLN